MIEAQARQQHFERVKCVWLELGTLAGVAAE
jgi:Zn finger protein HypA/HybF involved in hydrogenase expression